MPRVLLIGATGFVGSALSGELLRSGAHTVYGLARSPAKATQLAAKEIIPVLGSVDDSAAYLSLIKTAQIHVVVDCAGANDGSATILRDLLQAGRERIEAGGAKLGFVYCSGMWVHGSSYERVSDLDPVGTVDAKAQPPRMVGWRPQLEQEILAGRSVLDVAIIRPAMTYGREHSFWSPFFGPILAAAKSEEKYVQVPLDPSSRPGLIHVDDVASGFRCAIEKLPLISGTGVYPVFDLISSCEPMNLIISAAADVIGFKGEVKLVADKNNILAEAIETSINGDSSRAEALLGWKPKRFGFVNGMNVYIKAWAATQPST